MSDRGEFRDFIMAAFFAIMFMIGLGTTLILSLIAISNCLEEKKRSQNGYLKISIERQQILYLNTKGDKVFFGQNKSSQWYLEFSDDKQAFTLSVKKGGQKFYLHFDQEEEIITLVEQPTDYIIDEDSWFEFRNGDYLYSLGAKNFIYPNQEGEIILTLNKAKLKPFKIEFS